MEMEKQLGYKLPKELIWMTKEPGRGSPEE